MNAYDSMAPAFNRRRPLPDGVPERIRDTVLACTAVSPRILDLGAGAGRIAAPFLSANDNYIAADLSAGMLHAFRDKHPRARILQSDATALPFPDGAFDAIILVQVLSGLHGWRRALPEIVRTVARGGSIAVGRVVSPDDGIDAVLKERLAEILAELGEFPYRDKPRDDAMAWLERAMPNPDVRVLASWTAAERTPRAFVERHGSGARFSPLPAAIRAKAMARLEAWALERYGNLDRAEPETHRFELTLFRKS